MAERLYCPDMGNCAIYERLGKLSGEDWDKHMRKFSDVGEESDGIILKNDKGKYYCVAISAAHKNPHSANDEDEDLGTDVDECSTIRMLNLLSKLK